EGVGAGAADEIAVAAEDGVVGGVEAVGDADVVGARGGEGVFQVGLGAGCLAGGGAVVVGVQFVARGVEQPQVGVEVDAGGHVQVHRHPLRRRHVDLVEVDVVGPGDRAVGGLPQR